jgi:ribosome-associated heat shock protein Hsp15
MSGNEKVRIDKYLWAVRIFKTRSIAAEACRKGRVLISNIQVKPSRIITSNEIVVVKKLPAVYTYLIVEPVENRISAKLADQFIKDITPADEKEKLSVREVAGFGRRDRGTGRPTKRERRDIDRLQDEIDGI